MENEDTDDVLHFRYEGDKKWKFRVSSPPQWQNYTEGQTINLIETDVQVSDDGTNYYVLANINNETAQRHEFWAGRWSASLKREFVNSSVSIDAHETATLWMQGVPTDPNNTTIEWSITTNNDDPRLRITYKKV